MHKRYGIRKHNFAVFCSCSTEKFFINFFKMRKHWILQSFLKCSQINEKCYRIKFWGEMGAYKRMKEEH